MKPILLFTLLMFLGCSDHRASKCTGASDCTACKNCSRCAWCKHPGHTCGKKPK